MKIPESIPDQKTLLNTVEEYSKQPEFRYFLDSCINKWNQVRPEMELVDCIMESICQTWNISKEELISDRKYVEARNLFFYLIHKKVNLSYQIIGDMFGRIKGNVHSGAKTIEYMLENRKKKNLVEAYNVVEKDLLTVFSA